MLHYLRKLAANGLGISRARKSSWLMFAVALLLSPAARAQMSGTYTVCASGCNYSTINAAVTALKSAGINGKTTIEIKPGSYNESVNITGISGTSATNTLTFKGGGTLNTDVNVYNTNTYVFQISSLSYVTIENMRVEQKTASTYYTAIQLSSAKNCTIQNNRLNSPTTSATYSSVMRLMYSTDNLIQNNYLRGGGYFSVDMYSNFSTGNDRNVIKNNTLTKWYYYAIMIYYGDQNQYVGNYIDSATYSNGYGMYSYYETNNKVIGNTMANCYYGGGYFYHPSTTTFEFKNNQVINAKYYGLYMNGYANYEVYNNMISLISSAYYGTYFYPYSSAATMKFYHNTILHNGTNGYAAYMYNYYKASLDVRNNIFARASSGTTLYHYNLTANDRFEGNNYYRTGTGTLLTWNGASYTSLSAYQTAAAAYNMGQTDQSMAVTFKSTTDLHVDQSTIVPFGRNIGVNTDIDGDSRCEYFVTSGADESTYSGNPHYGKPGKPKFTGPSTAYNGNPTTYFNSGKASDPVIYKWFVDGKWVSDSLHLRTTALKSPSSKVKLVAFTCGGKDSMEMTVTVQDPPTKPTSDFISDLNTIRQGQTVKLTDLSTGYPSSWKWEISPKTVLVGGVEYNTYKYTYGDTFNPVIMVQFLQAGSFEVCLTASNVKGTGNKECKTAYIEVQPSVNVGQFAKVKNPSGYIYDSGGPNNDPTGSGTKSTLIDPCASDVWLVFNYFDMMCGYYHVRLFDSDKEEKGKELHPCKSSNGYSATGGLTGGTTYAYCYGTSCRPNTIQQNTTADTFHAKSGKLLIVQENTYSYSGYGKGFEAMWWSKPTTEPKPTAKFTSVDSICTNGFITFTNESKGNNITYYWDLDGDGAFDPVSGKNAVWPYFFPGNVTITLIAENCGGMDTFQKTIKVFNPNSPTVQFSADNTNPTINDVVFMKSDIVECVDEYAWTFTHLWGTGVAQFVNGTKNTSANPQVMFTDTGCYSVELYAKNSTGDDQFKLNCYIRVRGAYCQPSTMNMSQDLGISYVEFHTIKNKSTQGVTPYTSFVSNATQNATVEIGVTYPLTVERTTNKNKATRTAWIDWNQNGTFESTEKVAEETNATTLSWTKDITIPATAKVGATVMRIAITQGSQTNDPCGPLTYGEYEDYRLYVRPDLTKPEITMLGDDTVYVEQGYTYVDAGATAEDNLDGDITSQIMEDSSKFSSLVPKTYIWTYNVKDAAGNWADPAKRVVIVTPDKTAPELVVAGSDTIQTQVFEPFNPPAVVKAFDLVDGDMTGYEVVSSNVVTTKVGWYTVTYTLTDINSNVATVIRHVQVIDTIMPTLALVGSTTVQHEVGTPYADSGVTVNDNYYSEAELRANLTESDNLDVNTLGTYAYVYVLEDPFTHRTVTVTRTIEVVDTQAPVLALNGDQSETMRVKTTYADKGVSISDNYYKTLNSWDTLGTFYQNFPDGYATKLGKYTIIYRVTDPSGNTTELMREITVIDDLAPEIELVGNPTVNICRWAELSDEGYDLSDNYWSNDSITVTMEGSYVATKTNVEGTYSFRYKAVDRSGNVAYSDYRYVFVRNPYEFPCSTLVSIKDAKSLEKAVKVYPNPNSGKFTVEANIPANEQVRLTVTNMMGQEVAVISNGSLQSNKFTVDLSTQAAGVYLLNITTSTHTITKRIVVNK